MMKKYAFNSEGIAVTCEKIKVQPDTLHSRLTELQQLSDKMTILLNKNGIVVSAFDMMIQPFGNEEQLLFFSKEQLPSDGELVKQAGFAKHHPNYFTEHPEEEYLLKSIYGIVENGKVAWYLLMADFFCLTRNIADNKWITIQYRAIPYYQFVSELSDIMIRKEDNEQHDVNGRYKFYSKEKEKKSPTLILQTAVARDAQYQQNIDTSLNLYRLIAMDNVDSFSNEKTTYLWRINYEKPEHSAMYQAYLQLKKFLRQKNKNIYGIHYRNHAICFTDENRMLTIYVIGANPMFLVGGYVYQNLDALQEAYLTGDIWKEKSWFEKIKPYIIETKTEHVYYYKKKEDVLGLYQQNKTRKGRNV